MNFSHPKFAVVGHPNKGKSSIVSSLALDDSVQISDTPGTTIKKRSFPLMADGKILYELYDTPGFQRARQVLAWLKQHDVSADKKQEVVQAFINTHQGDKRFSDEVELLEPIMEGAGIIYVVDGSKPYGQEYEAEMEILRWTGRPSMALINLIDQTNYEEEWKRALGQYFKMVRVFSPMKATFGEHLQLLESVAQLKEEWIVPIKNSIECFKQYYGQMLQQSAEAITQLVAESLSYVEQLDLKGEEATLAEEEKVEQKYKRALRGLEHRSQKNIEMIWHHGHLQKEVRDLAFEKIDLFSKQSVSIFGLTQKELIFTGATGGAITGAGVDLLLAGHTLLLGGAIGAVVGGASAYFGFEKLAKIKVLGQKLGQKYLQVGPMVNQNFPFILLGRALYHARMVASRSHAQREKLKLEMNETFKNQWLDESIRKSLYRHHKKFQSEAEIDAEDIKTYEKLILEILKKCINV
ncbi:MAG: hypothetical protein QG564_835 [Campylobacterota bacterium]|nr:hypothetical protein [Campylobacterota bacterium]